MPFRFQAKYGLLTYAQCGDLDPFEIVNHLSNLGAECIIGRELHGDGGTHLHAFFMFKQKQRFSDERKFDVNGFHPNIRSGYSNPQDGYDYATKDGDICAGGLERPGSVEASSDSKWSIITSAECEDDFWAAVARLDPRSMVCSYPALRAYCSNRYRITPDPYITPPGIQFDTSEYPDLDRWVTDSLSVNRNNRYVILGGKPPSSSTHSLLGVWAGQCLAQSRALRPFLRSAPDANRLAGPTLICIGILTQ